MNFCYAIHLSGDENPTYETFSGTFKGLVKHLILENYFCDTLKELKDDLDEDEFDMVNEVIENEDLDGVIDMWTREDVLCFVYDGKNNEILYEID